VVYIIVNFRSYIVSVSPECVIFRAGYKIESGWYDTAVRCAVSYRWVGYPARLVILTVVTIT